MNITIKKLSKINKLSMTARLILFMILIATVLLITFSLPVISFLNKRNYEDRAGIAKLNAGYIEILTKSALEQLTTATIDSNIIAAVVTPDNNETTQQSMAQVSLSRLTNSDIYTDKISLYISESDTVLSSEYEFGTSESKSFEYVPYFTDNYSELDYILSDSHKGYIFRFNNELYMAVEFPQSGNKRLGILFAHLDQNLFTSHISEGDSEGSACFVLGKNNTCFANSGESVSFDELSSGIPSYDPKLHYSWNSGDYSYTSVPVANSSLHILNADSRTYGNTVKTLIGLLLPVSIFVILDFSILIVFFNDRFMQPLHRLNKSLSDAVAPINETGPHSDVSSENPYTDNNDISDIESSVAALIITHKLQEETLESVNDELLNRLLTELISGKAVSPDYYSSTLSKMNADIDSNGYYILSMISPDKSVRSISQLKQSIDDDLAELNKMYDSNYRFVSFLFDNKIFVIWEFDRNISPIMLTKHMIPASEALMKSLSSESYYDIKQSKPYKSIEDTDYIYRSFFDEEHLKKSMYDESYIRKKLSSAAKLIKEDQLTDAESLLNNALGNAVTDMSLEQQNAFLGTYLSIINETYGIIPDVASTDATHSDTYTTILQSINIGFCSELHEQYTKRKNKYIVASLNYIEKHYSETDLSLEKTADALGVHFNYLSRVFKSNMDETFTSYVNKYRIERSKELLLDKTLRISDICSMTGFGSQQNFTKVFKKYESITPGRYRELHVNNESK